MCNVEKWIKHDEYEMYEVSNFGNVRNIKTKKILKPSTDKNGYLYLGLHKEGKTKCHMVHKLVCELFIDNTDEKPVVCHKDGDKNNNCSENLCWVDFSEGHKKRTKSKNNTTGIQGVSYMKDCNKYRAYVTREGIKYYLGYFDKIEDASNARNRKIKELDSMK